MARKKTLGPTDGELAILGVLWDKGPSTVREVHEALQQEEKETGYTTTLKLMQIMADKGLGTGRNHVGALQQQSRGHLAQSQLRDGGSEGSWHREQRTAEPPREEIGEGLVAKGFRRRAVEGALPGRIPGRLQEHGDQVIQVDPTEPLSP